MKPDVTVRNDSLLYRFQRFFYPDSSDPGDTCEFHSRLLQIFLFWIPFFIFVVAALAAFLITLVVADINCTQLPSAGEVGIFVLLCLALVGAGAAIAPIVYLVGKLCAKFAIVRRVLTEIGLWAFAILLVGSMVLVVSGQSVFSLGLVECGLFFSVISLFGALAWVIVAVLGIVWGCARIFDSETYKKLKASAKEKWCAKITVVDKDGNEVGVEKEEEAQE